MSTATTDRRTFETLAARAAQTELGVYPYLPFVPERAAGCYVWDEHGERYLDFYCGHAVTTIGHSHPRVVAALAEQARTLLFYSNATLSRVRIEASEALLRHAPTPGMRVFYCCSGSEANEVALKIARKVTARRKVVSFERGFHGRTLGVLSATGLPKYRATAGPVLVADHVFVPFGDEAAATAAIDRETAAVIVEPIQSLAGVYEAAPGFFARLRAACTAVGAALIFDELQTGLGRCGAMFYSQRLGIQPDIATLAKGVASGVPCGVTLVGPQLAAQMGPGDQGSTFGGGPLVMAAMKATLDVIEQERLAENALRQGERLFAGVRRLPGVREVRGVGLLVGIETREPAKDVQRALLEKRVIVGTSAAPNVVRLLPPLTIGEAEVGAFLAAAGDVLGGASA